MKVSSSRRPDCTFGSAPSAFILAAYRTAPKHYKCTLRVLMSASGRLLTSQLGNGNRARPASPQA